MNAKAWTALMCSLVGLAGIAALGFRVLAGPFPGLLALNPLEGVLANAGWAWVDAGWLALFGLQHSGMARESWLRVTEPRVGKALSRSFYVLCSGLVLLGLGLCWVPAPGSWVWEAGVWGWAGFGLGAAVLAVAGMAMDALDLLGMRAVQALASGKEAAPLPFQTPGLYRLVRHPLYLGLILVFLCTPVYTADRLLLGLGMTAYVLIGMYFEEKDLRRRFGAAYAAYAQAVPALNPLPGIWRWLRG